MKSPRVFLFFFLAAFAAAAQTSTNSASGATTRAMSLQDCIQQALRQNYDVQIERTNPQIARYNLDAAYNGWDPVFNISGQHNFRVTPGSSFNQYSTNAAPSSQSDANSFNAGINGVLPWGLQYGFTGNVGQQYGNNSGIPFENADGSIGVTLKQPLLKGFWIDSTRLNIRVAKNRLKYSEQGLRLQLITSVTAVVNAYYELIYAQQNVQVQQEALNLAQTQLDQDKQRVQIGTLAILSVQQDESAAAQAKANLIAAQSTLQTDEDNLKNLLTDHYPQWQDIKIRPTTPLTALRKTFNLQESWNKGLNERPDLLQAKLNLKQEGIQLKYYRNQLFPELDLVGSYGFNAGGVPQYSGAFGQLNEGNAPFYSYGAQLTMPLSNVGPRNQYKSTKATLHQVLLQLKQLQQNIMVQIDNAVKVAESDYQSVQATRQARIYAQAALDAEQKTYAVGKATTFEVLQYQNNLTAARSQEIRALANYNEALATLAQQEGTTLQKYHISLEAK